MATPLENSTELVRRMRAKAEALEDRRLPPAAREIVEDFTTLDRMLSAGRRLPIQWKGRRTGREPIVEDGEVLEGVTHGRRYAYNKGCKCGPCRAANRGESVQVINDMLRERGWKELL
jgi:hypothetical protein